MVPRYTVRLVRENDLHTEVKAITQPYDAYELMRPIMEDLPMEQFHVILLDTKNQVIAVSMVSQGILDTTQVAPREIFQRAILCNASSIILVHNHPSGNPDPSSVDIKLTKLVVEAGNILVIPVLDHLIIGYGTYRSLKESGLM